MRIFRMSESFANVKIISKIQRFKDSPKIHQIHPPLFLPHFKPLRATSLRLPFCLPHFVPPSVIFASLHLISRHFTSPILSASLHTTSLCLLFFLHHFTSLSETSLHLPSLYPPHFTPLRVASLFSHSLHSFHATSFYLPFCLPHFTSLHATSCRLSFFSHSLHLISCHFTSPPFLSASLHSTSLRLLFFMPHFMPLHSTSLHLPSFRLTSPHFVHPPASLRWQRFTK